jgi:hypothetical protein
MVVIVIQSRVQDLAPLVTEALAKLQCFFNRMRATVQIVAMLFRVPMGRETALDASQSFSLFLAQLRGSRSFFLRFPGCAPSSQLQRILSAQHISVDVQSGGDLITAGTLLGQGCDEVTSLARRFRSSSAAVSHAIVYSAISSTFTHT